MTHPLERSGLAALSDLSTQEWRAAFEHLEQRQQSFLARESEFRSDAYRWPRDPLHQWSRVWEYPWVHHNLRRYRESLTSEAWVVDVGCGVTFFPFAVADLGFRVTGTDIEPVCETDLARAARAVPVSAGRVEGCRVTDGRTLPFGDHEVDAIYCISVLEHIPTWERTVDEMARILKPGGLLLLTVDLDLLGNAELSAVAHRKLVERLLGSFRHRAPERTLHPDDVLRSNLGPHPLRFPAGLGYPWFVLKQQIKPLLGKKPMRYPGGVHLAVHGLVLERL